MIIISLWSTLACKSDIGFEGTLVGNPGRGVASPAEGDGVRFSSGTGQLRSIQYSHDSDAFDAPSSQEEVLDLNIDLFDSTAQFPLQAGDWSGLNLNFTTININGSGNDAFELTLNDIDIIIEGNETNITVESDGAYYVELGQAGWLSLERLENVDSNQIDPTDPIAAEIANTLSTESAIFIDEDQDGMLSDEERSEQLLAGGSNRNDHLESNDGETEASDGD